MKTKGLLFFILLTFSCLSSYAQVYFSENFEGAFSGNPAAPAGWMQTRVANIGDGVPEPITAAGERDWEQNTWTGSAWTKIPTTPGTSPAGAQSGNGVLWCNDANFSNANTASRRIITPVVNLSASTSPYVRFYLWYAVLSSAAPLKVMASNDGGVTWAPIMTIQPNFTINTGSAITSALPWQRINVSVPLAYRTANTRIGIEMVNTTGTNNIFIDNFSIEEFTPTTITSAQTGLWNSTTTWVGGVVPTADNDVVIAAGHIINVNTNIARCQSLTVNGTCQYNSTSTSELLQVFGDLVINAGGSYVSADAAVTTGKTTFVGHNFTNNGTADFSRGTGSVLFMTGGGPSAISGTGTFFSAIGGITGRVDNLLNVNGSTLSINTTITVPRTFSMAMGTIIPNGNLQLGFSTIVATQTIQIGKGTISAAPIFNAGLTSRSYTWGIFTSMTYDPVVVLTGPEIQTIAGVSTITGTMLLSSFNNVQLTSPTTLGTATTGVLTLTRGILITDNTNILTFSPFVAPPIGTAPSLVIPSTTAGSYIAGPVIMNFPTTNVTRNIPLGEGTAFNTFNPSGNAHRYLTLIPGAVWSSQQIKFGITGAPSGTVNAPVTGIVGTRSYRLQYLAGSLPATCTLTAGFMNNASPQPGVGDNIPGLLQDVRLCQSPTLTGTWSQRSLTSGAGNITANTLFTRTTATAAPGPINTGEEFFAWGSVGPTLDMGASSLASPGLFSCYGLNQTVSVQIRNNGTSMIDFSVNPVTVNCSVTGPNPMTFPAVIVSSGTLGPNATQNVVISTTYDMSVNGAYVFSANTSVTGDGNAGNDAMANATINVAKVNTFPHIEGFSAAPNPAFTIQQVVGAGNWTIQTSGSMTNPTLAPVQNAGYAYFNSFSFSTGVVSRLITPCYDMSTLNNPAIDIWMSQDNGFAANDDRVDVRVSTDGGLTWGTSLQTLHRYLSSSTGQWTKFTIPLVGYNNNSSVRIALEATSVFGDNIGVDQIKVYNIPLLDVGVTAFTSPANNLGCVGGNQTVTVTIKNFTPSTTLDFSVNPVTVNCNVTGPNPQTFAPVVINSGTLAPNATQSVVISTTYNMNLSGTYVFNASTSLTGDEDNTNNAVSPYSVVNTAINAVVSSSPTSYCTGNSSQLNSAVPNASFSTYTVSSVPYAPLTGTGGTLSGFVGGGDDGYLTIPTPFPFTYFGNNYSSVNVVTNGYVNFGATANAWTPAIIPTAGTPDNYIALCWVDLNLNNGGTIDTFRVGTAPFRQFVIRYNSVQYFSYAPNSISGEIILYESTNVIDVMVTNVMAAATSKTLGIENANGSAGYSPAGRNLAVWNTTNEGWRFSPVLTGYSYAWTPATDLSSSTISNPVANPTSTTTYTITISNSTGCTATATTTVTVNPLPTVTVTGTTTICNGSNTTLTANGASTYAWTPSTGLSSTTIANPVANPTTTTTYTVTGTTAAGCTGTATVTVTVNPLPVVNLGSDITQCGGNVTLDAQNAGSTYAWSNSATTQTINVTSSGTYSVVVTNGNGCSNSDAINVTINTPPTVALGTDITQCGGTALLDAGNPGSTYAWSESSTTQTITVSASGTYSVVVTDGNGCTGTDAINVTINTPPTVALGTDITQCGGTVLLDAGNAGSTYAWSESSTTQTITVSASGTYSVVVTDGNGCTGSDAINVTINTPPTVALGPDVTQCGGTVLLDAGNAGSTYAWSDLSTTQTINVTSSGTYSVVVTDGNGCTGTDAIDVIINPLPVVNLGPDITQCGGSVMLDAQNPGLNYMWSTTETTQMITVSTGGTYSVTVTDGNGCSNTDAIDVVINPLPVVNLGADITQCGGNVTLDAQNAGSTYSWSDGSNTQTITVGNGNYYVIVTDGNGCSNSDTINVTINPGVTPPFLGNDTTICSPDSILLDAGAGYNSYAWSNGSTTQSIYALTSNTYSVTVSNIFGCTAMSSITVTVNVCTGTGATNPGSDEITLYPNPSSGMVYIGTNTDMDRMLVEVLDMNGQLVYSSLDKELKKGFGKELDLHTLANGVYSVRVNTGTSVLVKKLVIQQ